MPKISIIVPNFNYANFLTDALSSVQHQTFQDWECIVIDDASVDNSVDVINSFINQDSRFKLIQMPKHSGIAFVRNAGLDAATGDYIAFLDADDVYTQTALETLYITAKMTDADMVSGMAHAVEETFHFVKSDNAAFVPVGFQPYINPGVYMTRSTRAQSWFWLWRRIYKRSMIGDTRFNTKLNAIGEDIGFMLEIAHKAKYMADIPMPVVYHRKHFNSVSMRTPCQDYFDYFPALLEIAEKQFPNYDPGFWQIFYNAITEYIIRECIVKPRALKANLDAARATILKCAQMIPRQFLSRKKRFMFWYLSRLKNA
ncbi:MAG: glycosyltransferase family 2 protein [Alphaproteobacteria bacterium]|nr:glycosyltransferase family 2 protein [Alphaproteobacteria bacterium]